MIADALLKARVRLGALAGDELVQKLFRGGLTALIIKIASAGLSFLMFVLLARAMSIEEYGKFAFGFSLATFLSIVASCGMQTGILRWWPEHESKGELDEANAILCWGIKITAAASIGVALILLLTSLLSTTVHAFPWYCSSAALLIPPLAVAEYVACAFRAQGRVFFALAPRDLFWRLGISVAAGFTLINGTTLDAPSTLSILAILLVLLLSLQLSPLLRPYIHFLYSTSTSSLRYKHHWTNALPMWGAGVIAAATQYLDVVLLGLFLSPSDTGPYFAAARLATLLNLVLMASNMISAPTISRYFHSGDHVSLRRSLRYIVAAIAIPTTSLFFAFVAFGDQLLELFGSGYAHAYIPLLLLSAGFTVNALCGPTGYLLQMAGQEWTYLRIMASTYLGTIAFQLVAIPLFGMIGASLGTLLGFSVWNLWSRHVSVELLRLDPTVYTFFTQPCTPRRSHA
ncbi:Polysaccharide biosynthesis protein [Planctomycetes bacterium Pan216]|uniref:Polysaccharide biosynthesis protein n=1 Tax=Kolteria novifilia TaxID=2527975 RepID=A0A518B8L8_9BACT|nr:Polysaccharide biosynthesis protein [Planctomycetes bacterium Pan216]